MFDNPDQAIHTYMKECLVHEVIPDKWKVGLITPISKKGNPWVIGNLRPLSLVPFPSKILESFLQEELTEHFETIDMHLFTPTQHGFRSGRGTDTARIFFMRLIGQE